MNNYFSAQIEDLVQRAEYYQVESHFLTLEEQALAINLLKKLPSIKWELFGGYPQAIRKKLLLNSFEIIREYAQLSLLFVSPKAKEYGIQLTHRDFMGAILNLGINRYVVGDILVNQGQAYIWIESKLCDFILESLFKVKNTFVSVTLLESCEIPEAFLPSFEEMTGNIASLRLDLIVGWLCGCSRSKSELIISSGFVKIDSQVIYDRSKKISPNTIITIQKYGKFIFQGITGKSKKDRLIVKGLKYK